MTRTEIRPGRGPRAADRALIETRFPERSEQGAAAVLLVDGRIVTGTSPDVVNPPGMRGRKWRTGAPAMPQLPGNSVGNGPASMPRCPDGEPATHRPDRPRP